MPSNPLFKPSSKSIDIKSDPKSAFTSVQSQTQNVDIFKLMSDQLASGLFEDASFQTAMANAINDPQNTQVKLALAQFLNAYFGLTPTTPIEPIE